MQDVSLTLALVLARADALGAGKRVVSMTPAGRVEHSWREVAGRARQLAAVLDALAVAPGGRVATFAWNSHRHVELHLGVPCARRVLHAVNLRLSGEHIAYLVEHAGDEVAFVDASLTPLVAGLRAEGRLAGVREFVVMEDGAEIDPAFADAPRYEELLAAAGEPPTTAATTPVEADAAWICSTSGTMGSPKLVVTSHRSVFLHTLSALMVDSHGISRDDTVMPATPMFHVAAWGAPYVCAYAPANLVLTGRDTSPEALAALIESERVTVGFGVPTIWVQLERAYDAQEHDLSSLRTVQCGGAASPRALIDRYAARGVEYVQSWGMTEMSPIGTSMRARDSDQVAKVGPPSPGVELRLVADDGAELPWDGEAVGELEVRGPWIARAYLDPPGDANTHSFHDGWLRTGDLGRIDPDGTVEIVDRAKDLIKSGGEWISSLDLERALALHPGVGEAAVVAGADARWGERPVAFVVAREDAGPPPGADELRRHLAAQLPKWQVPERIELVAELPRTGVGKHDKRTLRARLAEDTEAHR